MSVQSAILFGLVLGITLFLIYLSIIAHQDQFNSSLNSKDSFQSASNLSPEQSVTKLKPKLEQFRSSSTNQIDKETILQKALTSKQQHSSITAVDTTIKNDKDHEVKIVSLSKAELSLLKKDHPPPTPKTSSVDSSSRTSKDGAESLAGDEMMKKMKKEKLSKFSELSPDIACARMRKKFNVVPNISWGTLPTELQQKWSELSCDGILPKDASLSHIHPEDQHQQVPPVSNEPQDEGPKELVKGSDEEFCWSNRRKYRVIPMQSWGSLPEPLIEKWKEYNCDAVFTRLRLGKTPITSCKHIPNHYDDQNLPLIAVMAATTTRKVTKPSTRKLALFLYLLPSVARTIDCGFRYEYVLGYDVGDPFYDSDAGMKEVTEWFTSHIETPLKENHISIKLKLVKVKNTLKKPGPVFIEMARAAYNDGATYFYRVNDDTELLNHWPTTFVKAINGLTVPYGVIGPYCNQGNERILTHDFVHRIHMDIFEMNYYPPQLTDWWMDDWISFVYGQTRTFKSRSVKVIHHTGAHGQRYTVDETHYQLLGTLIKEGRQKIRNYMLKKSVPENILQIFDKDIFAAGFLHRDIPQAI